jgi:hypothetical protein
MGVLADRPCSEMPSRPPLLLDPRQGDVAAMPFARRQGSRTFSRWREKERS